jgi:hypothetical protein
MLQQKIVIKVHMSSEKCRSKAMKIAATADGTYHASKSLLFSFYRV